VDWDDNLLRIILDTFDTCLLDLPEAFKGLDKHVVIAFRDFFRKHFFRRYKNIKHKVLRYESHVCYAFTKFTPEFEQTNNLGKSRDVKTNSELYIDPVYIKFEFATWIRMLNNTNSLDNTIAADECKKEFVNAFAMIRQIMQSNEYNTNMFFKIFNKTHSTKYVDKPYLTLLFSLTKEYILRDLAETQEWCEYIKKRSTSSHSYRFMEEIFMNNASSDPKSFLKYHSAVSVAKIYKALSELNTKRRITMHREHYFYQYLLFHPRFKIFNGAYILDYVNGLNKIGRFNNGEERDQIARDLVFSEYYHEAAIELKNLPRWCKNEPRLVEFKKSI
ncbi:hypothetical protein PAEPH01_2720, partial [Pancytospora epiphaga]